MAQRRRKAPSQDLLDQLAAIEAKYAALGLERDALRARWRELDELNAPLDDISHRQGVLEEQRDRLFDARWELRKEAGLDPRTGKSPAKPVRMSLPDEGYYPDLLQATEHVRNCHGGVEEHDAPEHLRHASCYNGAFHHFQYLVDGEPVAGLTITVAPRSGKATIDRVYTDQGHRRKGYAGELLDYARSVFPKGVEHSKELTTLGRAWKRAVNPVSLGDIAKLRVFEPLQLERVVHVEPVQASWGSFKEAWSLVVTQGKAPPYGVLDAGRILILPEAPTSPTELSEPLAGLVWVKEYGTPYVHSIWVDPSAQRQGLASRLAEAYRRHVSPKLVMKGPFSPSGKAFADREADSKLRARR